MGTMPHEPPYPVAGAAVRGRARWAPLTAPRGSDDGAEAGAESEGQPYAAAPPSPDAWLGTRPILYRQVAPAIFDPPPAPPALSPPRPRRRKSGLFAGLRRALGRDSIPAPLGYTPAAAAAFSAGLSDGLLRRASTLFDALVAESVVDSARLADRLGVTPGRLRTLVTEPLERRARALGLPRPFALGTAAKTRRRTWSDHEGVATILAEALRAERGRRADKGGRDAA